jgi:NTP pyrophosphatase (non-canonical NTP hydrolase)
MLTPSEDIICKKALAHYGPEAQALKACEELFELGQALMHWHKRPDHVSARNVTEELSDVFVMCHQLALHFGEADVMAVVREKLRRLERRMEMEK